MVEKTCGNCQHSAPNTDELDCRHPERLGYSTCEDGEPCEHHAEKDFMLTVYHWAWANMEGADEPELTLYSTIADAIAAYWKEKQNDA